MKVSRNWLNKYIDTSSIPTSEIVKKMPLVGNEIEDNHKLCEATNLVIGKVLSKEKHPDSEKLNVCMVDLGNEIVQIVCGAKNVDAGQKVIVAKIGATLPGGIKISPVKLRGIESNGMICALEELGIESKYVPERSKGGIHILDCDAPVGDNAIEYLCYNDEVIDFELTSNRSDLLSMLGMAYEFKAVYGNDVTLPDTSYMEIEENTKDNLDLSIQTINCPLYTAKIVRDIKIKESPNFIKARLMAAGIRPINNVVDISNYVMLEYGQPLHFFDTKKLGNKIIVRMAKDKEEMTTLDGVKRILDETDIVIANDKEIVALAGVMGGLNTEVDENTTSITIESAVFNPYNIRYTSKAVLRSEASTRYEKGIDTNRTLMALDRACHLLEKYADAKILKGYVSHNEINKIDKVITITLEKINNILGMNLDVNTVNDIFKRLSFDTEIIGNTFKVIIPSRRLDISIEEDLIEEVGRIHGYDNMKGTLPVTLNKKGGRSSKQKFIREIKSELNSLGMNEVVTYSLTSIENIHKFTNNKFGYIELNSPMSEDKKVLRHSLIPSLLNVIEYNLSRNQKNCLIYETSNIYYKNDTEYTDETLLSGAVIGTYLENNWQSKNIKIDFYLVKGIIENILNYLKLNNRYEFKTTDIPKEFHPGVSASIYVDNDLIGYIGMVHPNTNKNQIYVFEISIDKLIDKKIRPLKIKEIPKFPAISKDVAFIVEKDITSASLIKEIKRSGGKMLVDVDVFDIYVGDKIDENTKSIAFSLKFQDSTKTLTDEEIMTIFHKIIENVTSKFNAKLRDK